MSLVALPLSDVNRPEREEMAMPTPDERAERLAARFGAHLAVTAVTWRYDLGDEIARRHGMPMVTTICGEEKTSTLTTRRRDLVRCPACRAAMEQDGEQIDAGEASAVSCEQDTTTN